MIKFGWKGIALAFLAGCLFGIFNPGLGVFAGIVVLIILLVEGKKEKNPQAGEKKVEDYTHRSGSLSGEEIDLLYRQYASVIDEYHVTPLSLFVQALGKNRMKVMSDLNLLINNGRFQRARIEYDDSAFVVDEYTKMRSEEGYEQTPAGRTRPKSGSRRTGMPEQTVADQKGQASQLETDQKRVAEAVERTVPLVREESMRNVLSGIESSSNEIFRRLREDPELNTGETRRYLTFYLPKTVECIDNYGMLLRKTYLTDLEEGARKDLESALRAIGQSLRKILDSLSNHDAIDISSEAKAIQQMLENDGLTEDLLHMSFEREKV